jgi:DNA (cytosine-5)-methyltransferase 1
VGVKRPLADATMRRIAKGVQRYVIDAAEPFIVNTRNGERAGQEPRTRSTKKPYWTVTGQGSQGAIVGAHITPLTHHGERRGHDPREGMPTITGAHRGELALITPFVTEHANASNQRNMPADEALRTQCAEVKGGHFAIVAPHITKYHGESSGSGGDEPFPTITANSFHKRPGGNPPIALVSAFLAQHNNHRGTVPSDGRPLKHPASTITASGSHSSRSSPRT